MKSIQIFLLIIFLSLCQIGLMSNFAIFGNWPNLILIMSLVLIFCDREAEAFLAATFGGLLLDLASPMFFGFYFISLSAITLIVKYIFSKFLTEINPIIVAAVTGVTMIVYDLTMALINHQFSLIGLVSNAIYAIVLAFVFYYFFNLRSSHSSNISFSSRLK